MFRYITIPLWHVWYGSRVPDLASATLKFIRRRRFMWFPPKSAQHLSEAERYRVLTDIDFQFQQTQLALIRKRDKCHEQGIGPLDRRYPDIFEIDHEWGFRDTLSPMVRRWERLGRVSPTKPA